MSDVMISVSVGITDLELKTNIEADSIKKLVKAKAKQAEYMIMARIESLQRQDRLDFSNLRESPFGGLCCKGCGKRLTKAISDDHKCPPKPGRQKVDVSKEAFWD